jgi:hypothetical protein
MIAVTADSRIPWSFAACAADDGTGLMDWDMMGSRLLPTRLRRYYMGRRNSLE